MKFNRGEKILYKTPLNGNWKIWQILYVAIIIVLFYKICSQIFKNLFKICSFNVLNLDKKQALEKKHEQSNVVSILRQGLFLKTIREVGEHEKFMR